jgi:hypothetical protein
MPFHVTTRWGGAEPEPTRDRMYEVLKELDVVDEEHPDAWVTHESGWCLSAFSSGLLVWENLEHGEPRHMIAVSRERVLRLWIMLSEGRVSEIDLEPWLPGYGWGSEKKFK